VYLRVLSISGFFAINLLRQQWVSCVSIETGSTQTQTILDAFEQDVTSRNQTHTPTKHIGRMQCAYSGEALLFQGTP